MAQVVDLYSLNVRIDGLIYTFCMCGRLKMNVVILTPA